MVFICLIRGIMLHMENYDYIRSNKALSYKKMQNISKLVTPTYQRYDNAVIIPDLSIYSGEQSRQCGVVDENNKLISDSNESGRNVELIITENELSDKKVIYLGGFIKQWGHLLLDTTARMWCIFEDIDADLYVLCSDNKTTVKELGGNYTEFFDLLGISDKVVFIDKPTKYKSVIVPQKSHEKFGCYSPAAMKIFEKCVESAIANRKPNINENKKIFLSRSKFRNYSEFGKKEIDKVFRKNGFEIIYPERESLSYLINKINGAEYVASVSGSAAHNFVFAKKETKCIVIEKCSYANEYQSVVSSIHDINTIYIDANVSLLPVHPGSGPFILCKNKYLEQYFKDENFVFDKKTKNIRKYVNKYRQRYFKIHQRYPESWVAKSRYEEIAEAYNEAIETYGTQITDVTFLQKLKSFIKQAIKKVG